MVILVRDQSPDPIFDHVFQSDRPCNHITRLHGAFHRQHAMITTSILKTMTHPTKLPG